MECMYHSIALLSAADPTAHQHVKGAHLSTRRTRGVADSDTSLSTAMSMAPVAVIPSVLSMLYLYCRLVAPVATRHSREADPASIKSALSAAG